MAFKVMPASGLETDDTPVDDATSYLGVEEFILYWVDRNKDYSDLEPEAIQAALVKATDYIEARFMFRFKGVRLNGEQSLAWPRKGAYDAEGFRQEGLPKRLTNAVAEYAARALTAELAPDPTTDPNIKQKTETVGPISETTIYSGSAASTKFRPYPMADAWLLELCTQLGVAYR